VTLEIGLFTYANPMEGEETIKIVIGSKTYIYTLASLLEGYQYDTFGCYDFGTCAFPIYQYHIPIEITYPVHANDTVRFFYSGSPKPLFGYPDDTEWEVNVLFTKPDISLFCECSSRYFEHFPIELFVGVLYRNEIMLGESKYAQAYGVDGDLYFINDWTDTPQHDGELLQGVTFTVEPLNGSKRGVYWEQVNAQGEPDATGDMIRLIGRYWEKDSTFGVKVSATCNGETVEFPYPIYTMAPDRLLTSGQSPTYTKTLDVFNNERNIDSICIYYGGKYGIPPHFLKGQMLKEAGTIDYAGDKGFAPSYRFEPFSDIQFSQAWKTDKRYNGGLWFVDPTRANHQMGLGKDVPIHSNVCDMPYPRSPKTIWDILWDNSELVNTGTSKEHRVYGSRKSDGTFQFPSSYMTMNNLFSVILLYSNYESIAHPSATPAYEIGRMHLIHFLRDEWNGGAQNIVAQTRLASSYGLLQMMYSTAVRKRGYPSKNPNISPEDFNVTDTNMTYSLKYLKKLLQDGLTPSVEEGGNWPYGFEYWFKNYVWWPNWNKDKTYPTSVYSNAQKFLPQNK
jgi:hypothetical protein